MSFKIQDKIIGKNQNVFFIAEAGVNHNGSIEYGKKLIEIAKDAGADAVKFQTFNTEKIITKSAPKSKYHIETTGSDNTQSWYQLLKTQEMSKDMHIELIEFCRIKEIIFLSTPYDIESVDLLNELNVPAFKIASTDTTNLPFLKYVASLGKPMILSTAMANIEEIDNAVKTIKKQNLKEFAVLQCTGNYPSKLKHSNLLVINTLAERYNCISGYSDHTSEIINPIAAVALGAKIIEKHFTIDKNLDGPDHRMSLDPEELKETIKAVRSTEIALGNKIKMVLPSEQENRLKLRKSIVAEVHINKGDKISKDMIAIKRPGNGIQPIFFESLVGCRALLDIPLGSVIKESMINRDK